MAAATDLCPSSKPVNDKTVTRLSPDTWVPIGVALAAVIAFASGAVWINSNFQDLRYSVDALKAQVGETNHLRWTPQDMELWVERLRSRNKALDVPDVPR